MTSTVVPSRRNAAVTVLLLCSCLVLIQTFTKGNNQDDPQLKLVAETGTNDADETLLNQFSRNEYSTPNSFIKTFDASQTDSALQGGPEEKLFTKHNSNNIALATMCHGPRHSRFCQNTLHKNKIPYAGRHGYTVEALLHRIDDARAAAWSKIAHLRNLLEQGDYDFVFWMDADSVIMNFNKTLEDLVFFLGEKDVLLSPGHNFIVNTGNFLVKNTPWSKAFLDRWYHMRHAAHQAMSDNGGVLQMLVGCTEHSSFLELEGCLNLTQLNHHPSLKKRVLLGDAEAIRRFGVVPEYEHHVKWTSQRTMNSYHNRSEEGSFQDGDFILHCAEPSCPGKDTFVPNLVRKAARINGLNLVRKGNMSHTQKLAREKGKSDSKATSPQTKRASLVSNLVEANQLKCPANSCPPNQCQPDQMPKIPGTFANGHVMKTLSTYFSNNWGNVLSPYWAARAMAELGGYEYRGSMFGRGTWMEYLPTSAPARLARKEIFDTVCRNCTTYLWFHRGECSAGWGYIAPVVLNDTRTAILQHSKRASKEENDAIFNFFGPNDWLIYNRCIIFGNKVYAPGVLRTYDAIPTEGEFNVYILMGRREDLFRLCDTLVAESMDYMKKRNPAINVTVLQQSTKFVDFSRLVFAPNVLNADVGSSWVLWSAVLANSNRVVSHLPSFDVDVSAHPSSVHFLADVPTLKNPQFFEKAARDYGIPFEKFSNTSGARKAVLKYFRNAR